MAVTGSGSGYEVNHANVAKLLYGKTPYPDLIPIYPDLRRRAEAVATRARVLVRKRTGKTAASINVTSRLEGPFWYFRIEAHTRYAYYLHQGTRPHAIAGHLGGVMTFREKGKTVHARVVHHPGSRPNPYLTRALPAFMALRDNAVFHAL
jgi:hypothetical protein